MAGDIFALLVWPIEELIDLGGAVLLPIMLATFVMWALISERYWYLTSTCCRLYDDCLKAGERMRAACSERPIAALRMRRISEFRLSAARGLEIIQSLVRANILLGLFGTVLGMIEVFDGLASSGVGDARVVTDGIFKAIIPTLAGMVASLSGFVFSIDLKRRFRAVTERFAMDLYGRTHVAGGGSAAPTGAGA